MDFETAFSEWLTAQVDGPDGPPSFVDTVDDETVKSIFRGGWDAANESRDDEDVNDETDAATDEPPAGMDAPIATESRNRKRSPLTLDEAKKSWVSNDHVHVASVKRDVKRDGYFV